jgi:glycogen debranching enzyme
VKSTRLIPEVYGYPSGDEFLGEWAMAGMNINLTGLAGIPHFSTEYMRCWGRDVFISIRGLLLLRGKFDQAKAHIIAFGSTLRHGLIPNLLDQGVNPRYNARDAAWWWLYAVKEYCELAPEGVEFLGCGVKRRYPPLEYKDGVGNEEKVVGVDDEFCYKYTSSIAELCHEILERHARGITFREHNAGEKLDHAMASFGFDVVAGVDRSTGLVFGGNGDNCGTWMDKMGDSEKAGTRGRPATPRDGSAVEIVGLCKCVLGWVVGLDEGVWRWKGVEVEDGLWRYAEWNDVLGGCFEKEFWIPGDVAEDGDGIKTGLVNRRGIYKDTVGSSSEFTDYQLRPNFCVALLVVCSSFNNARLLNYSITNMQYMHIPSSNLFYSENWG